MYCPNCGGHIQKEARFCPKCGKSLSSENSEVKAPKVTEIVVGEPEEAPKKSCAWLLASAIGFIILYSLVGGFILSGIDKATTLTATDKSGASAVVCFFVAFLVVISIAASGGNRRPKNVSQQVRIKMTEGGEVIKENDSSKNQTGQTKTNRSAVATFLILLALLLVTSTVVIVFAAGGSGGLTTVNYVIIVFLLTIVLLVMAATLRQYLIKFVKYLFSRPKVGIAALGIFIIFSISSVLGVVWGFNESDYADTEKYLPLIQDGLNDAAYARLLGNSYLAGQYTPVFTWVQMSKDMKSVADHLTKLPMASHLSYYQKSAAAWASSISDAASAPANWSKVPDTPGDFTLSLSSIKAAQYLEESVNKLADLKQYGDLAIAQKDRATMYRVAAKILVQEQWLSGIANSTDPGSLGFLASPVFAVTYGPNGRTEIRRVVCTGRTCVADALPAADKVYQSAVHFAKGTVSTTDEWTKSWADSPLKPTLGNTAHLEPGMGVVKQGEPDLPPQPPAAFPAFYDQCHAKGGAVVHPNGTFARMPTTDAGGYECQFKQNGQSCWDLLGSTGDVFSGGDPGCPEENLLPAVVVAPAPAPAPKPAVITTPINNNNGNNSTPTPPKVTSWDGTYHVTYKASCNVPGIASSGVMPSSDSFTVSGNRVSVPGLGTGAIDGNGHASIATNLSASGISVRATQTFNFSGSSVSGNISAVGNGNASGYSFSLSCSGSFSGGR